MRHILLIAAFFITILVPSLALATINHAGEKGSHDNGGDNREMMESRMQKMQENAYAKKHRKAFNAAYGALSDADKTKFQEVVKSAVGEDMLQINQSQLVGFMGFTAANPTATCSVINATKEDMKSAFTLLSRKDAKRFRHLNDDGAGSNKHSVAGPGLDIKPALMCIAGTTKKLFRGLPATTLNKFYNANIQLASETSGTGTTSPAPTTASTQPSTSYGNYMTQSLADVQGKPVENTVFTDQSIPSQAGASSADNTNMHFSGNTGASH